MLRLSTGSRSPEERVDFSLGSIIRESKERTKTLALQVTPKQKQKIMKIRFKQNSRENKPVKAFLSTQTSMVASFLNLQSKTKS